MMTRVTLEIVSSAIGRGRDVLAPRVSEHAQREASFLLSGLLGLSLGQLWLSSERQLTAEESMGFEARLARRVAGEPLQYIEGRAAFRELTLTVDRSVLIPRPETEQLVERVMGWSSGEAGLTFLDVGTGSGAIAISLLTEGPFSSGVAVDISAAALKVAGQNALAAGVGGRVDLRFGTLFEAIEPQERFHVIVSNPPYIAHAEADSLPPEVRDWEPTEALFAGPTGLEVIERIIRGASRHLHPGGLLALEIAPALAAAAVEAIRAADVFNKARTEEDWTGRARFVLAELAEAYR